MDKNTIIETEWLILRRYELSDADDVVEGLNNINVTKYMAFAPYPYNKSDLLIILLKRIYIILLLY